MAGLAWACILAPVSAVAGAWPRARGTGFISVASRVAAPGWQGPFDIYSTSYLEFGLGHRTTVGLDIGHGISGHAKAILFLRRSFPQTRHGHRFAAELGLGSIAGEPTVRPGLSYGRSLTFAGGNTGWISVDGLAEFRLDSGRRDLKTDFTLGINHSHRLKSIFQLQTGVSQGDPSFVRIAPSLVLRVGPRTQAELGLTAGLVGDTGYGMKIGLWREF